MSGSFQKLARTPLTPIDSSNLVNPNDTSEVVVPAGATNIIVTIQGSYASAFTDFYISGDDGNSYQTIVGVRVADGYASVETPTNTNSYEEWMFSVSGQTRLRLQLVSITSGSIQTGFYAVYESVKLLGEQLNIGKLSYGAQVTGSITANAQTISIRTAGYPNLLFSINGTYGSVAMAFEASDDFGVTYYSAQALRGGSSTIETASGTLSNASRFWFISLPGATNFRVRATAWTSGTASIRITPIAAPEALISTIQGTTASTQSGTWNIGTVTALTGITNTVNVGGSVTVSSLSVVTGANQLMKGICTTSVSTGDYVIAAGVARKNTGATITSADGSYTIMQVTQTGNLRVAISEQELASVQTKKRSFNRADTFTATGNGTVVDASANPLQNFSILVKATGAVTSWDVRLEGSNDNVNFSQILQHTNVTPGDGLMIFSGATQSPCLYFRSRCAGIVLGAGTNVVTTILGLE